MVACGKCRNLGPWEFDGKIAEVCNCGNTGEEDWPRKIGTPPKLNWRNRNKPEMSVSCDNDDLGENVVEDI